MTPVKIGFVLLSNSKYPMPSTRIAVLNMFPFLRAANFDPHIVFEPAKETETPNLSGLAPRLITEGFEIIFFQKVHGPSVEELARQLSAAGIRTVYGVCDLVNVAMAAATDATTVVTDYLKSLYPRELQSKIHVVHDGIENQSARKTNWGEQHGSQRRPLRAVLVTSAGLDHLPLLGAPPEWLEVTIVGRYPANGQIVQRLREAYWTLAGQKNLHDRWSYVRFLTNRNIRCLAWDPVGVYECMRQADIGIIVVESSPQHLPGRPAPSWKVKSENRLTMKMCMGLPVIATPIPAYESIIEHGVNGFLARSTRDCMRSLEALRDPERRQMVGALARQSVLEKYSMRAQAHRLITVLRSFS